MKPLVVEVITHTPTAFFHCMHCELIWNEVGVGKKMHAEQLESGLPLDLEEENVKLAAGLFELAEKYPQVHFKLIDAASIEGFWKSLRFGLRRYPAFFVGAREKYMGSDFSVLDGLINKHLASTPVSP